MAFARLSCVVFEPNQAPALGCEKGHALKLAQNCRGTTCDRPDAAPLGSESDSTQSILNHIESCAGATSKQPTRRVGQTFSAAGLAHRAIAIKLNLLLGHTGVHNQ